LSFSFRLCFRGVFLSLDASRPVYLTLSLHDALPICNFGMRCAQVIATKRDFAPGEYRDNMVNCYEGLLSQGIIPIANEDDVTSLHKGKFSDNDELASLVAELIKADQMIILSDIDGVYNGDRKSTRLNSSHVSISYAVFCLKKKITKSRYAYSHN